VEQHGPNQRGFLGSTRYEVLDDPDTLVEIAEWESAEARSAHARRPR
jgi:heme-degrading monooxygenase HmoA